MRSGLAGLLKTIAPFIFILLTSICNSASAQSTTLKSRISVVSIDNKTKIWISDFPKKTNVVITDTENNLISIISTNDYGAAFLMLPFGLKADLTVKTVNEEITVTTKTVVKDNEAENKVASVSDNSTLNKA